MKAGLIGRPTGVLDIASTPFAQANAKVDRYSTVANSRALTLEPAAAKQLFSEVAREQWQYYADQVNATTNHLPPDNVRVDQGIAVDYRTSPTNIGLYMLSAVTAERLGFIGKAEMLERLRATVDTIRKLPKHEGHLYNWYSIDGQPKEIGNGFISTVDNGNFVAFLMAIAEAIDDAPLKQELDALISSMRFDVLFDRDAGLLYHGAHVQDGKLNFTGGHYDMIITEARCAYAAAIMQGQIPESAWTNMKRKLGKEIDNLNVNRALQFQSYTGTMFEYLTPRLLMKHEGTPMGDADLEAVKIQIADKAGGIWGRSEANSNTSKGYAAWGARKLSQSKEFTGTGDDIIAPYACQMAAGIAPLEVAANLRRMEEVGLRGQYGYYESCAVKTKGRDVSYEIVPQFYAHHIGMGFLGMANHLLGDVVTDWFHAADTNEKLPGLLSAPASAYAQPAAKAARKRLITNAYAYEAPTTYDTREVLGNGQFVTYAQPIGASTWASQSYALTHNETFYLRDGERLLDLGKPAVTSKNGARSFEYQVDGMRLTIDVSVSASSKAKISKVSIDNRSGRDRELAITGYLDWILDDINAWLNHPVYRNLYVSTELSNEMVIARRRTMHADQERQPYGFFAVEGGADRADGSRTSFLGRLGSLAAPLGIEGSKGEFGATLDPAAALSKKISVKDGATASVTFVAGHADQKEQIGRIVRDAMKTKRKGAPHYPPDPSHSKMVELAQRTERDLRIMRPGSRATKGGEVGHFEDAGRTYVVDDPFATKKPWSMVVSNGEYGFVATAAGWSYSFGANSQQDRITPYIPDNTSELPLRGVMVKDKTTGEEWSIAPNPAPDGDYKVKMSPGSIEYIVKRGDLTISMTQFVAKEEPAELWKIAVENEGKPVDLELSSFVKWATKDAVHAVIGGASRENQLFGTEKDPFSGLTTDLRVEKHAELAFVIGKRNRFETIDQVNAELDAQIREVKSKLDSMKVSTPDPAFDTMLNTWLPYQAYYAHFLARSGYYQSGGAYGFRDQLQTVMNLLNTGGEHFRGIARGHIVESTRHQFDDGSVQHWWHPNHNLGQRSTISDNLLWLPYALSHYLDVTGDRSILEEKTPFSVSRELKPGELDLCEAMPFSEKTASVYEHAKLAIDRVVEHRMGEHGLPLIGKGDWNDGLDRVGHLGKGESVWNAFFLYDVLTKFAAIADPTTAERYRAHAAKLKEAIDEQAWNGEHFIRAYADSGEKIDFNDAIVQAWAVLSRGADPEKAKRAIASAVEKLYKPDSKTILLFDRVLEDEPWGGSLAAYPNGLRENNAQYTHGSSWLPRAAAELGDGDLAMELFHCLLPTVHASDPRYGAEPYVVAADIYGGDKAGEGGWTWYSGGPGWIYRTGVEKILGLAFKDGDRMLIDPCIPKSWPGFSIEHKNYRIEVKNPDGVSKGVKSIRLDGKPIDPARGIRIKDDGKQHRVEVVLGLSVPTD